MNVMGTLGWLSWLSHPTPDFCSSHDLWAVRRSPTSGLKLGMEAAGDFLPPLSLRLTLNLCVCFLSLLKKKKVKMNED